MRLVTIYLTGPGVTSWKVDRDCMILSAFAGQSNGGPLSFNPDLTDTGYAAGNPTPNGHQNDFQLWPFWPYENVKFPLRKDQVLYCRTSLATGQIWSLVTT
jgi:hypothetical protein